MCRCPTMTAYRSQKVEAVRGGTGRPGEPGEEFRPTDPRGLQSGHRGMGSVLLTGGQSQGRRRGRCNVPCPPCLPVMHAG